MVGVSSSGQPLAGHPLRPLEAILLHEWRASCSCALAHAATGREGFGVVFDANGRVHGTEEELEVGRAFYLDERPVLVHLELRKDRHETNFNVLKV